MKYYLVGIKGTGMTSLACMLKDLGHQVRGSDVTDIYFTDEILKKKKIEILPISKNNINGKDTYIIGNSFDKTNQEVAEILKNDYEYYYYHQFIGKIMDKKIIAISGTHGKTTTTFLLAQMLSGEYSYIIGDGSGYGNPESDYLLLEACEYKMHFLAYTPEILLINNIELDHPDCYKNVDEIIDAFQKLVNQSREIIINNDDINSKKIKHLNKITFGFSKDSLYQIKIIEETKEGYLISLINHQDNLKYEYVVPFFGKHMIYNFVSAIIICQVLGKSPKLDLIFLPRRRMTTYQFGKTIIIDDYAHHPTEIKCLYESIKKKYSFGKINVIFQPHTYSRTLALKNEFIKSLDLFDEVYIEKTFTSKREKRKEKLEKEVDEIFKKYQTFNKEVLKRITKEKSEVWVFLGAGTVDQYINEL